MIYLGSNEIAAIKLGNTDISAIYAGDLLIWPTSVTGWSVTPATIEMEASGGTENIRITSLSAWSITSSESWITFSQNSGDSGRTTVEATIASHTDSSARTATITVTDGTNVSTISVSQEAYADYASQYLTFEILSAGTISWKAGSNSATKRTIQYSKNGGSWVSITSSTAGTSFSVAVGDKVRFKGTNTTYSTQSGGTYANSFSGSTAVFNAYGNVMSMIRGDDFLTAKTFSSTYVFRNFFNTTKMVDASNLVLAATALTEGCYMAMFGTTTMLQKPPKILPATTLAKSCYFNMFLSASTLTEAPILPAMTLTENCYRAMFYSCTNLTTAPELPAPTLATNCYYQMFDQCSKLNYIKCLATNILAASNRTNWVRNVAASGTFVKAASMTSWPTGTNGIPSGWTVENNT